MLKSPSPTASEKELTLSGFVRLFYSTSGARGSFPKQQTTNPHHIASFLNRYFVIGAHAHAQNGEW